ncbi:recombinase family protein [Haloferax sp. Atlit-12N]|uniref:recombinase family protein n=1 Tax=Haloferax sp. Atlit-12N TaxID=2077203 RepID=UPI000E2463DF|nr:recombinase family protein [Haloferax sp. Atlit-12N]RDZ64215.1 recombinase family protein [Haloferax sp. Atlit-12N]
MSDQLLAEKLWPNLESEQRDESARAAVYARTSSVNQRFGYSLDEQVRQCWQRCERVGWDVDYVYRDEAESGHDIERPAFQRMLQDGEKRRFDVVVFWKLDRLSRSIIHAVEIERRLREYEIALHSVTEQLDTTTPSGRFNFRNIANAAEFERELIRQRTKMGLKAMALEHKWPNNRPPLGYSRLEDGRLAIDAEEAELVREIFKRYIREKSMPNVAVWLNEKQILTRGGKPWSPSGVKRILTNELYIGRYRVSEVDDVVEEYQIVEEDIFERTQTVRRRFQSKGKSSRKKMSEARKSRKISEALISYQTLLQKESVRA